ncbi:MAG: Xaa-Pro peptidase family protein [Desulfobacterales bacterium]|jgi:Xaa-Pro dipeptidase
MSKEEFTNEEFQQRHSKLRKAMAEAQLDLFLVTSPISIHWLLGSRAKSYQEFQCLFFPQDNKSLAIITRMAEVAEYCDTSLADEVFGWGGREPEKPITVVKQVMKDKKINGLRIGLEVPYYYLGVHDYLDLKAYLGDSLVLEDADFIARLKHVKSSKELEYIRKAAEIGDAGLQKCVEVVREGMTEIEISAEITYTLLKLGSDAAPSPMNIATGERNCYPHALPTHRKIKMGDDINTEWGSVYRRYVSTVGRQMCLGRPRPRVREIYNVVREACDASIAEVKHGVPASVPHDAAKKVIADAGMDDYRTHLTGYSLAPGYPPSWCDTLELFGGSEKILEAGMVITIEPPIHIHKEKIGARIIDNVLVTENGAEILSRFTRDLIIL